MVSTELVSTLVDFGAFIMAPLDRALTILVTASSIFIGNRYLEGFRKAQEQKKIAKLIIVSIQGHLKNLEEIFRRLNGTLSKNDVSVINALVDQIQDDYIYESAIKQIGIFELEEVDVISNYSRILNSILSDTISCSKGEFSIHFQGFLKKRIKGIMIIAKTYIMILSKKLLQKEDKFNEYKELVKNDYALIKIHDGKFYSSAMYGLLGSNDILKEIELLFKEHGSFTALEDAYKTKKQEYEKWVETEKSSPNEKSE